jgi:hypothetical protein
MNRYYTDDDIREMYEELSLRQGGGYLKRAQLQRPTISNIIVLKCIALGYVDAEDPALFVILHNARGWRRSERIRSSPVEQLKGLTSLLNQYGELTGGNYRSSL